MPKKNPSELVPATSKFRDIGSIMKDPQAAATLSNYIDEAVTCKAAIATQQQLIKAIRERALEELSLNPKLFNAYVAASFNNDYVKRKTGLDEQVTLLEHIMKAAGIVIGDDTRNDGDA